MNAVAAFKDALLRMDGPAAQRILQEIGGKRPVSALETLVTTALEEIGNGWDQGSISLSQIYMGGRICEELIDQLLPSGKLRRRGEPRMAIATFDDYHMLGKRLVYSVLRSAGHELLDYGRVDVESVLRNVARDRIQILLLSVLMLPSALHIGELRCRLDQAGLDVRLIVGGAPFRFDKRLWREVGADAMGRTASDALRLVPRFSGVDS